MPLKVSVWLAPLNTSEPPVEPLLLPAHRLPVPQSEMTPETCRRLC